jgi:hypothetical protein
MSQRARYGRQLKRSLYSALPTVVAFEKSRREVSQDTVGFSWRQKKLGSNSSQKNWEELE